MGIVALVLMIKHSAPLDWLTPIQRNVATWVFTCKHRVTSQTTWTWTIHSVFPAARTAFWNIIHMYFRLQNSWQLHATQKITIDLLTFLNHTRRLSGFSLSSETHHAENYTCRSFFSYWPVNGSCEKLGRYSHINEFSRPYKTTWIFDCSQVPS